MLPGQARDAKRVLLVAGEKRRQLHKCQSNFSLMIGCKMNWMNVETAYGYTDAVSRDSTELICHPAVNDAK